MYYVYSPPYFYANPYYFYRQYPEVDINTLKQSVNVFQQIYNEANMVLKRLEEPTFAKSLMTAAQMGNQQEVDRLIKSIGANRAITTTYTPTGIKFNIDANSQGSKCCSLSMFLRWGK